MKMVLFLCFFAGTAWSQSEMTPETYVAGYFEIMKKGDFETMATMYSPSELKSFREMMSFMEEIPEQFAAAIYAVMLGEGVTRERLREADDQAFFVILFGGLMRLAETQAGIKFQSAEVLGSVTEGEIIHVLARATSLSGTLALSDMEVISLEKTSDGYQVLMSGEIKGLGDQIKDGLRQNGVLQ
jgi:hypothetical protein